MPAARPRLAHPSHREPAAMDGAPGSIDFHIPFEIQFQSLPATLGAMR
jgi:hypothetical protein